MGHRARLYIDQRGVRRRRPALALVEEDHGRELALEVARSLVLFLKRSGGQAQLSSQLRAQMSAVPAIRQVQLWCHENLDADLRIGALAKRAGMSERSFIRKFVNDTGRTPAEFVASARFETACRLLEETGLPLKAVAQRCVLGTTLSMRRIFIRRLGVSPLQYRAASGAMEGRSTSAAAWSRQARPVARRRRQSPAQAARPVSPPATAPAVAVASMRPSVPPAVAGPP